MKLYGIAIAALPGKTYMDELDITCTPISVTDKDRTGFKVEDGAFRRVVNFSDIGDALDCFLQTVALIDSVVKRQKESLSKRAYRPVVLEIGQDDARPIDPGLITIPIFGSDFSRSRVSRSFLVRQLMWTSHQRRLARANRPVVDKHLDLRTAKDGIKARINSFAFSLKQDFKMRAYHTRLYNLEKAWGSLISDDKNRFFQFRKAAKKLSGLLTECTLDWGSYNIISLEGRDEIQQQLDIKLKELKECFFQGDLNACAEIASLAREEGRRWGQEATKNPNIFGAGVLPKGYFENSQMQEENPRHGFYDWDPSFRKAFYAGY